MYVFVHIRSLSGDNCIFGQKYGSARNGVYMYMFEKILHVIVNFTIRLWFVYWNKHAFHTPAFLYCYSHSEVELFRETALLCENSSSSWYRCMGVTCRAMWSMSWCTSLSWAVARWVKACRGGRVSTTHMHCSGQLVSIHIDMAVTMIEQCMHEERLWPWRHWLNIQRFQSLHSCTVYSDLKIRKIAAKCV
jgi:hypothetical protein